MCDLTARLLHSMQDLVTEIHDLPTIEAPLETSQQRYASLDIAARVHARMSLASRPSSQRRQSQKSPIRHSVASPSAVSGRDESRDRSSMAEIKRTRSAARTRIVLGALSLQAGLWPDAIRDLSEGTAKAKQNNDHVWHAKGLEYIVACLFMFGWAEMSFQIPHICYPTSEKAAGANFEGGKNRDLSLHYLTKLLPDLLGAVNDLYSKAFSQTQDAFPQFLMSESILRRGLVLSMLSGNGKIDGQLLNNLLAMESVSIAVGPGKTDICALLIHAVPEIPQVMPLSDLLQILIGLASLLFSIGMARKQAFVLGDLLQRITPGLIEARKVGAAEAGIHPAAGLLSLRVGSQAGYLRIEEGMRALLTYVGSLYGQGFGGNFDLQIETLKSCIAICEALPDFQGVLDYSTIILQAAKTETFAPLLSVEDQTKILAGIKRAVAAASRLGIDVKADYWDEHLVRVIEARPPSVASRLVKHVKKVSSTNPFIYNPYEKQTETEQVLVAGETTYFTVCLQNPFEFEVEIENINLLGTNFSASQHSIVLGSLSRQNFSLAGTPQSVGTLTVTGCQATIKYCKEKTYYLYDTNSKTKDPKTVSWTVLGRQPVVSLQSTALSQPSLMVLKGETRSFNITLQNHSDVPANLFRFSFHDSATAQLQEALTQDLSPVDRYELEYQLSRPPLKLTTGPKSIATGGTGVFTIEVFGVPGLLEATVQINYAHVDGQELYTRQLSFRIAVTVNAGVEVLRSNLHSNPQSVWQPDQAVDRSVHQCLLLLDLRNVWPFPLLITVQVRDATGEWSKSQTESLLPGHVSRMVLLVPRLFVADAQAPIPLQNQRQFVVSASQVPPETERAGREAFWYREELLKHIRASWEEDGREGTVVLRRGIRLSPRMVETLRLEDIEILIKLQSRSPCKSQSYQLQTQTFAWLVVQVHNRSSTPLHLSVRIQPSVRDQPHNIALDLSKRFAWTGMLQKALHPALESGEIRETKLGIMALCAGDYEIGATVEELREAAADRIQDRRIWHSRELCQLDVVDQLE